MSSTEEAPAVLDTGTDSYPIIRTIKLDRPEYRFLRGPRRDSESIPQTGPHETLVICVGGEYQVHHGQFFRGTEDFIANATSVSVVDTTSRRAVKTRLPIPSRNAALGFELTVNFSCTVEDPALVVRRGVANLVSRLTDYLESYPSVLNLGAAIEPEDLGAAREMASLTLRMLQELDPVFEPGMTIELSSWAVEAADEAVDLAKRGFLQAGEQQLGHHWAEREVDFLRQSPDGADARYLSHLLSDPQHAQAARELRDRQDADARAADERRRAALEREDRLRLEDRADRREYLLWRREDDQFERQVALQREQARREDSARLLDALGKEGALGTLPPGPLKKFLSDYFGVDFTAGVESSAPAAIGGGTPTHQPRQSAPGSDRIRDHNDPDDLLDDALPDPGA